MLSTEEGRKPAGMGRRVPSSPLMTSARLRLSSILGPLENFKVQFHHLGQNFECEIASCAMEVPIRTARPSTRQGKAKRINPRHWSKSLLVRSILLFFLIIIVIISPIHASEYRTRLRRTLPRHIRTRTRIRMRIHISTLPPIRRRNSPLPNKFIARPILLANRAFLCLLHAKEIANTVIMQSALTIPFATPLTL
jgi:hypothetical protein